MTRIQYLRIINPYTTNEKRSHRPVHHSLSKLTANCRNLVRIAVLCEVRHTRRRRTIDKKYHRDL